MDASFQKPRLKVRDKRLFVSYFPESTRSKSYFSAFDMQRMKSPSWNEDNTEQIQDKLYFITAKEQYGIALIIKKQMVFSNDYMVNPS